jgi:predicted AAA+ superfamily ATPase
MRACAIRSGNILNKSELAKDVGIHHKTVHDWLSVLQASNQIILLEPYFSNETKRIVKSPKLYFNDTGLLCALLGLGDEGIDYYANIGAIWETFLFAQLRKYKNNYGQQFGIWFYRDQSGLEVDFVIEAQGRLILIESKWSQYPDKKSIHPMLQLKKSLSNIDRLYVICRTESDYPLEDAHVRQD